MALDIPGILYEAVWSAIEEGAETPALVRGGNRMDQRSPQYKLRDQTRIDPTAFPNFTVEIGEDVTDSGYTHEETYAQDDPDFLEQTTSSANREITESVRVIITDRVIPNYDVTKLWAVRQAVIRDVMRAAPNIDVTTPGLMIWRVGPFQAATRDGLGGQAPNQFPVKVCTIRFPVTTIQEIRASLA